MIKQKITVITGGSRGLGYALGTQISKNRKVLLISRDILTIDNDNIYTFNCDISNYNDIEKFKKFILDNNYEIDYLFNVAGVRHDQELNRTLQADIDNILNVNLKGMIYMTSAVLNITSEEEKLTIINVMSTASLIPRSNETVYCAAKFGAKGFTDSLRIELGGKKRNIIGIYPGGMNTQFWKNSSKDTSGYMDPYNVAKKIIDIVYMSDNAVITDIIISRDKQRIYDHNN